MRCDSMRGGRIRGQCNASWGVYVVIVIGRAGIRRGDVRCDLYTLL